MKDNALVSTLFEMYNTLVPGGTCDIVLRDVVYDPSCSIMLLFTILMLVIACKFAGPKYAQ